jgi:serine/threonine protein kinase
VVEQRSARGSRRVSEAIVRDPQPGATIGRYTIVRLIARGGVGLVYLARQSLSNAAVVVKVLAANLVGDAETSARFDREAQRLRGVQHPNIVTMVDYGHAQGSAFLVMEYLQGELLSAYLQRKGRLTLVDFAPIAAQILKAVGYAHGQGLMHRDLKPTNIMLCTRKGRANFVKILDFGMAKLVEGERDITSEQIVGTANYLSPEQIRGEATDARVDVYAIGVTFYALLCGHLPFQADNNAALLYKHVHEAPPPLADALPPGHDIPPGLIELVHRCLTKDPALRPIDANAVVEALIDCVPATLFHLPVADGNEASASSSYAMLPLDDGPAPATAEEEDEDEGEDDSEDDSEDEGDDQLTRPVVALQRGRGRGRGPSKHSPSKHSTANHSPSKHSTANHPPSKHSTASHLLNQPPPPRPVTAPLPVSFEPPASGGRVWLVLAGVVLLLMIAVGALVLSSGSRVQPAASGPTEFQERRLSARLDQVEADILGGEFERARTDLDVAESEVVEIPQLRSRAGILRLRLRIAMTLATAQELERQGQVEAALGAYGDVLALDSSHTEARAALARLRAPTPVAVVPAPTRPIRPKAETRPIERPVTPAEVTPAAPPVAVEPKPAAPPEPDDGLLRPSTKPKDDAIFLPVNGPR